jgi:predicted transposase YbfD/YdcC
LVEVEEYIGKFFDNVSDPRSTRNQKYKFTTLIGTSLLAMLSGIESFSGMQDFVDSHLDEISKYFDLSNGIPSHDTYQRFWDGIIPDEFLNSFHLFTETLSKMTSDIVNIDGKTIRNSGKVNPLHIVSAWCRANQLVLAQEKVSDKSNEITAIPKLLELLDLENKIITIDAVGAQRKICQKIIDLGGDYVICLKANQKNLHNDVIEHLKNESNHELINEENDKGHGRIEKRTAISASNIDEIKDKHNWPGLQSIGLVKVNVLRVKSQKESNSKKYYISSLPANAARLNEIARSHWSIENQLHWRLDVTFNEDKACIRNDNAAENIDILRKWALNLMQKAKEKPSQSIKSVMRKNSMSFKYLLNNVKRFFHA